MNGAMFSLRKMLKLARIQEVLRLTWPWSNCSTAKCILIWYRAVLTRRLVIEDLLFILHLRCLHYLEQFSTTKEFQSHFDWTHSTRPPGTCLIEWQGLVVPMPRLHVPPVPWVPTAVPRMRFVYPRWRPGRSPDWRELPQAPDNSRRHRGGLETQAVSTVRSLPSLLDHIDRIHPSGRRTGTEGIRLTTVEGQLTPGTSRGTATFSIDARTQCPFRHVADLFRHWARHMTTEVMVGAVLALFPEVKEPYTRALASTV